MATPIQVRKTLTLSGLSWADEATYPNLNDSNFDTNVCESTGVIAICAADMTVVTPTPVYATFASGSWTRTANGFSWGSGFYHYGALVARCAICPDGSVVCSGWDGTQIAVNRAAGSLIDIVDNTSFDIEVIKIISDSSSNAYIFLHDQIAGSVDMYVLTASNSLSGPYSVATGLPSGDSYTAYLAAYSQFAIVFGTDIFISLVADNLIGTGDNRGLYRSPVSSPSFVLSLADSGIGAHFVTWSGFLYNVYAAKALDGSGNATTDQMWIQAYLGSDTWATATMVVDFLTYPPIGGPDSATGGSSQWSSRVLSNGAIAILVGFTVGGNANVYYLTVQLFPTGGFGNILSYPCLMTQHPGNVLI